MEESGPHKQSILRNKEVSLRNAPRKPRDVTRPTVMVKRLGFRGTLPVKYKIDFWNNPITASILVWNQVVLNQSQQLGYLNSKLMLSWDCPFKEKLANKVFPLPNLGYLHRIWAGLNLGWIWANFRYITSIHFSSTISEFSFIRQTNPLNGGALYMKHASWWIYLRRALAFGFWKSWERWLCSD